MHRLKDSSLCETLARPGELTLAFIDGHHGHPWPLADVMQLLPLFHHDGWIVMHDIDLAGLVDEVRASGAPVSVEPRFGAQYVFVHWPDEKIGARNIGAIKVPADRSSLGNFVEELRGLAGEVSEGSWKKRWRDIDELAKKAC